MTSRETRRIELDVRREQGKRRSRRESGRIREDQWVDVPVEADVLHAIGGGHTFESAVADIVDNSIDAHSDMVRIRFLVHDDSLVALQIRDNGSGMDDAALREALSLGHRRSYQESDLGHFGIGLKAASMRYATTLTVYATCVTDGVQSFSGVELSSDTNQTALRAKILTPDRAQECYTFGDDIYACGSGTVVEWAGVKFTSSSPDREERAAWLDQTVQSLRTVLGLAFHRIISRGDLRIEIDVLDIDTSTAGAPRVVTPVDPFGYKLPGRRGYPLTMSALGPHGTPVKARCHILPPKGKDQLPGAKTDWQGLYFYRNDRLLTLKGGWRGLVTEKPDLRLARVEIDLTDDLLPHVSMTPEKNQVALTPDYSEALRRATCDDGQTDFIKYLSLARSTWKDSNKRSTAKPLTRISTGLPEAVIEQLGESFGWRGSQAPVDILWARIDDNDLFKINLAERTLKVNSSYESIFGGSDTPSAAVLTPLLYLLVEENFTRESHLRTSTLEHLERIDSALIFAISAAIVGDSPGEASTEFKGTPPDALVALHRASSKTAEAMVTGPVATAPMPVEEPGRDETEAPTTSPPGEDSVDAGTPSVAPLPEPASTASSSVSGPSSAAGSRRKDRSLPTTPLSPDDLRVFEEYCAKSTISQIASSLQMDERTIVTSLVLSIFGPEALDDDETLAPYHGMPYTPDERDRILLAFKKADNSYASIPSIAAQIGRTPFAIAWKLLDSPKRPIPIDKRFRRSVRARASSADAVKDIPV